jgi:hypothetical protein
MPNDSFGNCCKDLHDAMTAPPTSLFRVETNGVLYLAVGYIQTEEGVGWYDHAVIFCPFCGHKIQDEDEIQTRSA